LIDPEIDPIFWMHSDEGAVMLRRFVSWLESRLAAARAERALASLPERLRRDVGAGPETPEDPRTTGMIYALDPALLRQLRDPEPLPPTTSADEPTRVGSRPRRPWRGSGLADHAAGAA
jgi:hypothetical protein